MPGITVGSLHKEVSPAKGCRPAGVMKTRLLGANWVPASKAGLPLPNREGAGDGTEVTESDSMAPPHQNPASL